MFVISILAVVGCLLVALLPLIGRSQAGETVMKERTERFKARQAVNASVLPLAPQTTAEPATHERAA